MGTIKERKMFLNKMAEQTIVEFKHAKKYFKSVCVRRKGKQKEKRGLKTKEDQEAILDQIKRGHNMHICLLFQMEMTHGVYIYILNYYYYWKRTNKNPFY